MTIRKEILEAIKDGTITPEEGLNLLEEIEQAETIDGEKKTESAKTVTEPKIASVQESEEVEQKVISESVKEAKYQNQVESSQESGAKLEQEVDYEANQELKTGDPKTAQETKQEKLQETEFAKQKEKQLEPEKTKDHIASLIDEWETNDHQLHTNDSVEKPKDAPEKKAESKENASLMKLNQLDQQIQPLNEMLKTKQETFRNLKLEVELEIISEENLVLYQQTQKEIAELETKIKQLKQEKGTVEKDFYSIPVWQTEMPNHDDTPEEFYEHEEEVDEPFVRPDNFNSRINQLVNRTLKTVADTVDGKWSDIKLPAVGNSGNTRFDHRFNFKEEIITNLDVKLANGSIIFKTWPRSYIMVDAEIKLHGKMYEGDPMESFMERSQIAVEYEHLLFHVHNKRVSAELTFHLPEQTYNHIKIRMLNGNLTVKNVEAEDLFVKSARGELVFKNIGTAVLEIQGTDNEIEIDKGVIVDSIIETVNGSIVSTADVANVDASLVNGDIKLSIGNSELKKFVQIQLTVILKFLFQPLLV